MFVYVTDYLHLYLFKYLCYKRLEFLFDYLLYFQNVNYFFLFDKYFDTKSLQNSKPIFESLKAFENRKFLN
jgi:hypothetical protein